jgi:hypothetical protein
MGALLRVATRDEARPAAVAAWLLNRSGDSRLLCRLAIHPLGR